ncbi:hypothetical protein [Nostoc sp. UHCC 0870]|uniref:hypothetical protein n=1 Tax=Nostoc sp. UHCC 0870 TaxID=2914041 RepID=UPI0030D941CF
MHYFEGLGTGDWGLGIGDWKTFLFRCLPCPLLITNYSASAKRRATANSTPNS